jgi:hypothetical protein
MIRFILGLLLAMGAVESEYRNASLLLSIVLASLGLVLAAFGVLAMHKRQAIKIS